MYLPVHRGTLRKWISPWKSYILSQNGQISAKKLEKCRQWLFCLATYQPIFKFSANYIIMQFGRISEDVFTIDYRYCVVFKQCCDLKFKWFFPQKLSFSVFASVQSPCVFILYLHTKPSPSHSAVSIQNWHVNKNDNNIRVLLKPLEINYLEKYHKFMSSRHSFLFQFFIQILSKKITINFF